MGAGCSSARAISASAPEALAKITRTRTLESVCAVDQNSKPLGKGSFGTVYKGQLLRDGRGAAVKIISKKKLRQMSLPLDIVSTEVKMMRRCSGNDKFVQLYDFVDTKDRFCLVLELCSGGNLQDAAMSAESVLKEGQVKLLMQQMLESIAFLHSKNICHRDIKCHNYLVEGEVASPSVKVKLGDFGTAVNLPIGKLLKEQVGTPAFMSPELHLLPNRSSGYDHTVDIWAAGVCLIFLLASEYPFIDGQGKLLRDRIIQGSNPLWEVSAFQALFQGAQEVLGIRKKKPSRAAQDLTRQLLAPRRQDRLSADAALQHEWFVKVVGANDESDNRPLLDMKLFQDAFSRMERDVGTALKALSSLPIAVAAPPDTPNEMFRKEASCVVCYNHADELRRVCPQCQHTVCGHCIPRLPQASCPYCRHANVFADVVNMRRERTIVPDDVKKTHEIWRRITGGPEPKPLTPRRHSDWFVHL
jgi:serine/threonine protein kinase